MPAHERATDETRWEFEQMQRVLFVIRMGRGTPPLRRDLEEAGAATARGEDSDRDEVRRAMSAKYDV